MVAGSNRYQRPLRPISSPNGHRHFTRARKHPAATVSRAITVVARSSPTPSTLSLSPTALLRRQQGERPFFPPLPLSPPPAAPPAAAAVSSPALPLPGHAPWLAGALSPRAPATRSTKCGAWPRAHHRPCRSTGREHVAIHATSTSPSMPRARHRPCRYSTSPSMHAHVARLDVAVHNGLPVEVR
jgi:hypothetical protein